MTAKDYIAGNADTNANGATIDVFAVCKTTAALQVIAAGLSHADATMKVQESNDGTNWVDVSGATITLASGASSPVLAWTPRCRYARTVYTKGANTAGTYTSKIFYR